MPTSVPSITTLPSARSTIVKKALIIGAATAGLIAAGAISFAIVKPSVVVDVADAIV